MNQNQLLSLIEKNELVVHSKVLSRGELLIRAGDLATQIYIAEDGCVCAFIMDGQEEHIVRFGYKHNIIVALDSFLTNNPTAFYFQAIRKTKLKIVPKKKFLEFINRSEENKQIWISLLENLMLQQIERERDLLIQSPQERYERVLKRSPELFQEVPKKYIAAYLRMSAETLSRLKKS